MDDAQVWASVWLGLAAVFGVGELLVAGSFFLIPFAIGALAAALLTFITGWVWIGLVTFLFGSLAAFIAMRPLAKRMDDAMGNPMGVGANRLIGDIGSVSEGIPAGHGMTGMVNVQAEVWNAECTTGSALPAGSQVRVVEVRGTRVLVEPVNNPIFEN